MIGGSFLELVQAAVRDASDPARWEVEAPGRGDPWIRVRRVDVETPAFGWKLHVSATERSGEEVLGRILPLLVSGDARFKLASSTAVLAGLNEGEGGLDQVGKFVTVYPGDEETAVRMAEDLHRATSGLRGPAVRTDRPFVSGSLVHYRYGPFTAAPPEDLPEPADPFEPAGPSTQAVGGRYVVISTLHRSPRGTVELAADLEGGRRCVLKRAYRDARVGPDGRDARDRLRREADLLERLSADPRFPVVFELFEEDGDLFLAMERLEGETLHREVTRRAQAGRPLHVGEVVDRGRRLAAALGAMHAAGIVHRDVNAGNVIVDPRGAVGLVDLEMATDGAGELPPGGTSGYVSPQQERGDPGSVSDDVYALGAVLLFAATGAEPPLAPRPDRLLDRPMRLLNPSAPPELEEVVRRSLDPEPGRRFGSAEAFDAALGAMPFESVAPPIGGEGNELDDASAARHLSLAGRLAGSLRTAAQEMADERGTELVTDLGTGTAGIVLALAELASALPEVREPAEHAARSLAAVAETDRGSATGLYEGRAGVGAALLRAGQVLAIPDLVSAAASIGRSVAASPPDRADLFDGAAGRLRFHLLLWEETHDEDHLENAVATGRWILSTWEGDDRTGARAPAFGYARGTAGVADALLDLGDATGDEESLQAAVAVGGRLLAEGVPALDDDRGLAWPEVAGGPSVGPLWCVGATGIGLFFLHLAELDAMAEAAETARRAAWFAARGGRWLGPEQCHGLAGTIEYLLDVAQWTGEPAYVAEAASLARVLEAFVDDENQAEAHDVTIRGMGGSRLEPGYLTGAAGIAVCLLRLADPWDRPRHLRPVGGRPRPPRVRRVR